MKSLIIGDLSILWPFSVAPTGSSLSASTHHQISVAIESLNCGIDRDFSVRRVGYKAASGVAIFELPGFARIGVFDGRSLIIDEIHCSEAELGALILANPLCALMFQRGAIVLHSAACIRDGFAHLLAGAAGLGKSVLCHGLTQSGFKTIADDFAIVDWSQELGWHVYFTTSGNAIPELAPCSPAELLGRLNPGKRIITSGDCLPGRWPIKSISILQYYSNETPAFEPLSRQQAVAGLINHTVNTPLLPVIEGRVQLYRKKLAELTGKVAVRRYWQQRGKTGLERATAVMAEELT